MHKNTDFFFKMFISRTIASKFVRTYKILTWIYSNITEERFVLDFRQC